MTKLHYFAYGSNLHPYRLQQRCPGARLIGSSQLAGWRLHFHKLGQDGSGKCNIVQTGGTDDAIFGAVFELPADEKPNLDEVEGEGYSVHPIEVSVESQPYSCFVYLADTTHIDDSLAPFQWYQELVFLGARYHAFPQDYLQRIDLVQSAVDPDLERIAFNQQIIMRIMLQ